MKTALFAEGPVGAMGHSLLSSDPFVKLWQDSILGNLGLKKFDFIYPINKKYIISMRPNAPKMSGASIGLDKLIERARKKDEFECAVVAWDLVPGWAGGVSNLCRWDETVEFYKGIERSIDLPGSWTAYARKRVQDLTSRNIPSQRNSLTKIVPNAILAVCMETMFESLIAADEAAVREILGGRGKRVQHWPKDWNNAKNQSWPDKNLLDPAIKAARGLKPKATGAYAIRGDMITAKHEWGAYFLDRMLGSGSVSKLCENHSIVNRLRDIL